MERVSLIKKENFFSKISFPKRIIFFPILDSSVINLGDKESKGSKSYILKICDENIVF